jgi:hypothetical protein
VILLVTQSERASACVVALQESTHQKCKVASLVAEASAILRDEECTAVVVDQHLFEAEPNELAMMLEHSGTAIQVNVNLAISGIERIVKEVQVAVARRKREEIGVRQAVGAKLTGELKDTLTTLLLSTEMLMKAPDLSPWAAEQLSHVHDLEGKLRQQLNDASTWPELNQS